MSFWTNFQKKQQNFLCIHLLIHSTAVKKTLPQLYSIKRPGEEIIVFDGGSRDEIVEIEKRYADKLIREGKPGTAGGDRNKAAMLANGDIIVSIEGEDFLPSSIPEKLQETFEDEDVVGVTCDIYVGWGETFKDRIFRRFSNTWYRLAHKIGMPIGKGDFLAFKKEAFRKIGGFKDLEAGEDTEIFSRLKRLGKIKYMDCYVFEAPDRYHEEGHLKTLFYWLGLDLSRQLKRRVILPLAGWCDYREKYKRFQRNCLKRKESKSNTQ